jgi:nucleotide-binding universal stress UspA family protein
VENLAHCFRSRVIFLQVIRSPRIISSEELDWVIRRQEIEQRIKDAEYYLAVIKGEFREKGIDARTLVVQGPIVKTIINLASHEEADLIAMTSHGRSGLARVFYGSVAAGVLHLVDRPLLLIRSIGD